MTHAVLFRIETAFLVCDVTGPATHRHLEKGETPQPFFNVVGAEAGDVTVTDASGNTSPWKSGETGPALFEDVTYRFYGQSKSSGLPLRVSHRDQTLLTDLDTRVESGLVAGTLNFQRQIGRSDFILAVGADRVSVTVEVLPTKLDYQVDYDSLLRGVQAANSWLVLEYLRATYRLGSRQQGASGDVGWLTLLRDRIHDLEQAVHIIERRPLRSLRQTLGDRRPEKLRRVDATAMQAIRRGTGSGTWQTLAAGLRVRSFVPSRAPKESLDTPEHRWIAQELRTIAVRLEGYERAFALPSRTEAPNQRTLQLREEFRAFRQRIVNLSQSHPLQTSGTVPAAFLSLQLTSALGYADAYRNLIELRHALTIDPGTARVSVSDLHELYESWCFLEIVRQLSQITGAGVDPADVIQIRKARLGVALAKGSASRVRLQTATLSIVVEYNPRFRGLTGDQIPDILIRVRHAGQPDSLLALDAKYRLDSSEAYTSQFGSVGPPRDALNALHRYRDAITDDVSSYAHRSVKRGVALFPLSRQRSTSFGDTRLSRSLRIQGIGALPFLPGNTAHVEEWLREMLALPPEVLALPGPPYPAVTASAVGLPE